MPTGHCNILKQECDRHDPAQGRPETLKPPGGEAENPRRLPPWTSEVPGDRDATAVALGLAWILPNARILACLIKGLKRLAVFGIHSGIAIL